MSDHRVLGKTGYQVNPIGLGTWSMGGSWGSHDEETSMAALRAAVELGVDFFDTADNYGDGRSERLLGRLRQELPDAGFRVATKMGRRAAAPEYTVDSFRRWVDSSRRNLGVDQLDLIQLHCPPPEIYGRDDVFDALDTLVEEGSIAAYGVSVATVEQALASIARPGVAAIQIVFNVFRQRPVHEVFGAAEAAGVGIIARIPLASGLLTGQLRADTAFAADDHRSFNRHGERFDVGETFAGVDYEQGLAAVEELRPLVPPGATMAQFAIRWILGFPAVGAVIPGASSPRHVRSNVDAARLAPLPPETVAAVERIYRERIAPSVEHRW